MQSLASFESHYLQPLKSISISFCTIEIPVVPLHFLTMDLGSLISVINIWMCWLNRMSRNTHKWYSQKCELPLRRFATQSVPMNFTKMYGLQQPNLDNYDDSFYDYRKMAVKSRSVAWFDLLLQLANQYCRLHCDHKSRVIGESIFLLILLCHGEIWM